MTTEYLQPVGEPLSVGGSTYRVVYNPRWLTDEFAIECDGCLLVERATLEECETFLNQLEGSE